MTITKTSLAVVKPAAFSATVPLMRLDQAVQDFGQECEIRRNLMRQQIARNANAIAFRLVKQAMKNLG